jgi:hypothetical protein
MFFFEKKNQKTFRGCFARVAPSAAGIQAADCIRPTSMSRAKRPGKVFCFFFSKKKCFLKLAFQDLTP